MTFLAATGGSLIFIAFVVLMFFVLAYTYYTKSGSAIDMHPSDGLDGAPGSSRDENVTTPIEDKQSLSTHGTR